MGDCDNSDDQYPSIEKDEKNETTKNSQNHDDYSASSSEDEDAKDIEVYENEFFQALAWLKSKDPEKYDTCRHFSDSYIPTNLKNKGDKPFISQDTERNLLEEKENKCNAETELPEEDPGLFSPINEVQNAQNDCHKQILESSRIENIGNLFQRKKTQVGIKKENYREWLRGEKKELEDLNVASELKALHDFWNDPELNSEEVYLRDYILNHKFLDSEDKDFHPSYNETVHGTCDLDADMKFVDLMDEFEYKYNNLLFLDKEFSKQYPRCVENAKKKKEIWAKIQKIQQVCGKDDVNFRDEDFEEDFDSEKHDQKMREIFNDDYYQVEEEKKPKCPELDRELEIENWEKWQRRKNAPDDQIKEYNGDTACDQHASEAPDFNINSDDPQAQLKDELIGLGKSENKQKSMSKLAAALLNKKPVFDPNEKSFEDYYDEYYKLDCEDIVDDLPCRFKYRQTIPNDYGLTTSEILRANTKELNKWCSLKRIFEYKPQDVEKREVQIYKKKTKNEVLKQKILPSLYIRNKLEDAFPLTTKGAKKKENKKRKLQENEDNNVQHEYNFSDETKNNCSSDTLVKHRKKKHNKQIISKAENDFSENVQCSEFREANLDCEIKKKESKCVESLHINPFCNSSLMTEGIHHEAKSIYVRETYCKDSEELERTCNNDELSTSGKPKLKKKKRIIYLIGTLNISTPINPEKLKELISVQYKNQIQVLALQGVVFPDTARMESEEYEVYKGKYRRNPMISEIPYLGTGFIVNRRIANSIAGFYSPSEHLSILTLQCENKLYTLINCYAPMNKDHKKNLERVECFWKTLAYEMRKIPENNVKILLGDFNALIGKENEYKEIVGNYPVNEYSNKNGKRLIELCRNFNLKLMSTSFKKHPRRKVTWTSPYKNLSLQVDHVAISFAHTKELMDVQVRKKTKYVTSNHYLTIVKMKFILQNVSMVRRKQIDLEFEKAKRRADKERLKTEFRYVETSMARQFKIVTYKTKGKHQWWNEKCQEAVEKRKQMWMNWYSTRKHEDYINYKVQRSVTTNTIKSVRRRFETDQLSHPGVNFSKNNTEVLKIE